MRHWYARTTTGEELIKPPMRFGPLKNSPHDRAPNADRVRLMSEAKTSRTARGSLRALRNRSPAVNTNC